jgi:hypothetical protein
MLMFFYSSLFGLPTKIEQVLKKVEEPRRLLNIKTNSVFVTWVLSKRMCTPINDIKNMRNIKRHIVGYASEVYLKNIADQIIDIIEAKKYDSYDIDSYISSFLKKEHSLFYEMFYQVTSNIKIWRYMIQKSSEFNKIYEYMKEFSYSYDTNRQKKDFVNFYLKAVMWSRFH